jgi:cellulose synthase/poly-beta-1,6-N-acetylglucosamine synthase-like glycosyltransferase
MLESAGFISFCLLALLGLMVLVQLYYIFGVFGKIAFYKPQPSVKKETEPVSVIIAARNELENLQKNLVSILEQDYPNFEVIVVNHCSWDSSQAYLEELQTQYKHLKVSQLLEQEKYPTGKKFALTIGIKAAKNDLLIFTDADCVPHSNQWLQHMQSRFTSGKDIVLGFSPYKKYKGFLNLYIRFETLMTALFYFSAALLGRAFMGVGRNMAYKKDLFFKHKGFAGHQHIMSGDDDLFVNAAATRHNVAIDIHPESFVYSEPKHNYAAWSRQKTRHMTTGKFYKKSDKRWLGWYYASHMLFYALIASILIGFPLLWPVVVGVYAIRFVSQEVVFYMAAQKFKCTGILWFIPLLDLMYVFYLLIFGTKGLFTRNSSNW